MKKKPIFIILGFILFAFVLFKTFSAKIVSDANKLQNETINIKDIPNGTYNGHSELGPVIVDVQVTIKNGNIEKVEILNHQCGFGQKANQITDRIKNQNTYNVDAISGATVSSKVIMNAVNNALQQ